LKRLSGAALPLSLLSQYLPLQFVAVREGRLENSAGAILRDGVAEVLRHYAGACEPGESR
jgi:D-tagatose-1,6-bisphosphate aldolase subunit GatZ/KbaZ